MIKIQLDSVNIAAMQVLPNMLSLVKMHRAPNSFFNRVIQSLVVELGRWDYNMELQSHEATVFVE